MSFPEDVNSNTSSGFFGRKLILAMIIAVVVIVIFAVWFFFISDTYNATENSDNYVPSNCYSINGKQTCPPNWNITK